MNELIAGNLLTEDFRKAIDEIDDLNSKLSVSLDNLTLYLKQSKTLSDNVADVSGKLQAIESMNSQVIDLNKQINDFSSLFENFKEFITTTDTISKANNDMVELNSSISKIGENEKNLLEQAEKIVASTSSVSRQGQA